MKRHLAYKPSGNDWLGDIPESWHMKRLKYISSTRVSNVDKKSEDEIAVRLCNYIDVYKNEFINEKIDFMKATATRKQIDAFELKKGDVILTKDSETPDDIGIPAYVDLEDTKNIVCGYHLAISTPINSILLGKYLFRLFQSNTFRAYFGASSNGITRYGLDTYSIYNANIPLPPFPEQCIIADFLDRETGKIDQLISKKQRLMELLKEERVAIINQAVIKGLNCSVEMKDSGNKWIGEVPKHWDVKKIKYLISFSNGYAYSSGDWVETGKPVIRMSNISVDGYLNIRKENTKFITEETAKKTPQYLINKGDLLIAMTDMSSNMGILGRTIIFNLDGEYYLNQRVGKIKISSQDLNQDYLFYVMNTDNYRNQVKETVYPNVQYNASTQSILNARIPIPPIKEQLKIVEHIKQEANLIDLTSTKIQKEIDLLQEYRAALISEVVTGKIDVRNEVVSWT